ncbi:MAG: site-specific integrase [Nitrosopumilus sp.]|nr:site-specific integrase [Nitrosopumilus sp.]
MKQKITQSDTFSIYDYDKRIERTYNLMKKELDQVDFSIIKDYDLIMIQEQISKAARHKHLQTILNLSRMLQKNWKDTTKSDIANLVKNIVDTYSDPRGKETHSSHDHKKILKIFFRWFKLGHRSKNEVGDPIETKDIKIKRVENSITREDLITPDDRIKLIDGCNGNPRNEALIDCSIDAGSRAGELLNLKIKHVSQDKYGYVLKVDGKTGQRPIRIIEASPKLALWMNNHPLKQNPESPLWPQLTKNNYGKPLSYSAARQVIVRAAKNAHRKHENFNKRIFFTLFRHSEATRAANFMTQSQMTKRHGWVGDSKMPDRYVHLVNADVDNAIFKYYGIKTENDEKTKLKVPKVCNICEMHNPHNSNNCSKCGKPLDLETALEQEEKEKEEKEETQQKLKELEDNQNKILQQLEFFKQHTEDD